MTMSDQQPHVNRPKSDIRKPYFLPKQEETEKAIPPEPDLSAHQEGTSHTFPGYQTWPSTMPQSAAWQAPSRPMPAQEYQHKRGTQSPMSSLPSQTNGQRTTEVEPTSSPMPQMARTAATPPAFVAPPMNPEPPQRPRRRVGMRVLITLLLL